MRQQYFICGCGKPVQTCSTSRHNKTKKSRLAEATRARINDIIYTYYIIYSRMSDTQKIISDIYFDKAGYGSRKTTLEDAKKKEPTIKKEDVEDFFRKKC